MNFLDRNEFKAFTESEGRHPELRPQDVVLLHTHL